MKIVIIGMGMIGKTVLDSLTSEGHDITIIDENKDKVEALIEKYDCFGVIGNGASKDIQLEAQVNLSDITIVVTDSDEVNILACLVAKKLGTKNTIARVRKPEYRKQIEDMEEQLGLSMIVNPERETSNEIFNLIDLPSVAQIEHFAKGMVSLVEILVEKGCSLVGESLISISKKLSTKILVCAVSRGAKVVIPSGNFVIEEGDRISIISATNSLGAFLAEANLIKSPLKKVMIVGGGRIGFYLAEKLLKNNYKVKLIESNKAQAEEFAKAMPKLNVINGDGTDHALLIDEGIGATNAFVAITGNDEENIIVSMFANKQKVKKTITMVKTEGLMNMLDDIGIDNSVSPKNIVADKITSYIRAISNKRGSKILTLYHLVKGKVQALEFSITMENEFLEKPLKKLKLKENCLIASIIRDNRVIIPNGNSYIMPGDNVIVVTTQKNFSDISDILA